MRPARRTTVLVCAALVSVLLPADAGAADLPTGPAAPAPPAAGSSYLITLVTGDRVRATVQPGRPEQVLFLPGPGSRSDAAVISYAGGHTFVVPSAAGPAVRSGQVDRSLFDVTTLIAQRYDDRRSATLPVIVEYAGAPATALGRARGTALPGATASRLLTSIGARAATIGKSSAHAFWDGLDLDSRRTAVARVSLDDRVEVALDQSVPQIGAPAAWQRGLTGRGVKIAVLDTGVDATHPDLAGRVLEQQNFSNSPEVTDRAGHGTHVAGIAAGNGTASGGAFKGVAPEATILNAKVLDDQGGGFESAIIAGMEWAAARGAAIANLSLGSGEPGTGNEAVAQALNRISRATGTLFVVAAGNCFSIRPQTVTAPGVADDALTVGSTARDGSLSAFSCRGPRKGDGALKPEITAPGERIVAARAAGTVFGQPVDEHHTALSGTSMATPHVAGTAALLVQAEPSLRAAELKARLISTADPQPGSTVSEQGAGRVDADQVTAAGVTVSEGELELGVLRWPLPPDDAVARPLTYTNPGGEPVTLRLTADLASTRLSATEVVVPAGGETTVTVTTNRSAGGPGMYAGRITATPDGGADPLVTTIGWYAEPESYDLTVRGIDRDGAPAESVLSIGRPDGGSMPDSAAGVWMRGGQATVRLPAGVYDISSTFVLAGTDDHPDQFSTLSTGDLRLGKDTTVVLDARAGVPVGVSVSHRDDLNARERSVTYRRATPDGRTVSSSGVTATGVPRDLFAVPTGKATAGVAEFATGSRLEEAPYRARVLGGGELPVADFYDGPRFTGTKVLRVADAGTARPEELSGVRGRLALIRRTFDTTPHSQAYAAQQAGAAAVVFFNPAAPGTNGVNAYWSPAGASPATTIPAMRTSRTAATELLRRPAIVWLTGVANTRFSYDLLVPWDRIPADATATFRQSEFAVIDESFGTHVAGTPTSETRFGSTPAGGSLGGWLRPAFAAPYRRTSYVLGNDTSWSSWLMLNSTGTEYHGFMSDDRRYRPGQRTSVRWFSPVANSTIPATGPYAATGVARVDDGLRVNPFPFGYGPNVIDDGFGARGQFQVSVERDGEVIGSAAQPGLRLEVPARAGDYRISLDATRDSPVWRYSTAIRSRWDFRSSGAADEVMPLLLADLSVPQADALNQVRARRPVAITLGLRHQTGSAGSRIATAKLEISYDGTHWTALPIRRTSERSYRATVVHPAARAGQAPSLRVTATDAAGGELRQEITRAYGVIR